MSEDSIASDSISCRTEANAPLLPPRKRLLAGLKQNGWPSPSSSSCAVAPVESPQLTETIAHAPAAKADDLDENCVDAADGGSLQSLNGAAESLDSHNKGQRKPKRHRASSSLTMKKSIKRKRDAVSEAYGHVVDDSIDDLKASPVVYKTKSCSGLSFSSEKVKDEADLDAVASKISSVVEEHSVALVEGDLPVEEKQERVTTGNGEALPEHAMNLKLGSCVFKEEEEVTCNEAGKPSRNTASKAKKENRRVVSAIHKRRKSPNRQVHCKTREAEHKNHEVHRSKISQMPLPLADEEIARQLHRAMNSSPRIARCLSHKEERPLVASSRKRFPGN